MAAARNHLFPQVFAKENKNETPAFGIVISSVLVSMLTLMNFSNSLANTYKFAILMGTLTCLVAYLFSIVAFFIMDNRQPGIRWGKMVVASLAFIYSMWAVIGSGEEIVYWGFILLMAGLPFYAWIQMRRKKTR
jgi:APA family basic amino acid/polyamine antiporter